MNLPEIEAFLAVVQTGSLSKASQQLFITQPTLSHRIQTLEKELGYQLLIRSKGQRQVELTYQGREFVLIAEKWLTLWEESKHLRSASALPAFRAAATQTLSTYVMPDVYSRFIRRKLPVALEMYSFHYRESYEAVENRTVDAVFVSRIISSDKVSAIHVCSEKMVLLCSKSSPYAAPIHPGALPLEKGIYMLWNHNYAMWHEYWFGSMQYSVYADSMRLVEGILADTDLWAIVPISAARAAVVNRNLHYLPLLESSPPDRPIYLLTLEPQNPYTKLLVEDLLATLEGE